MNEQETSSQPMNERKLIESLEALAPWHQDFEITRGIRTAIGNRARYGGTDHRGLPLVKPRNLRRTVELLYPEGLAGKSFLDVGCNGGGYCFLAKSMGAARTLGFDPRDHWIKQAEFVRQHWDGITEGMEFRTARLAEVELDPPFDLTLLKGVFYHLPDPIGELIRLGAATREAIIVNSACRSDIPEAALLSGRENADEIMSGVDGLCWYPGGPQAVVNILQHAGFSSFSLTRWRRTGKHRREIGRFQLVAARSPMGRTDWSAGGYGRG